MRIWFVFLLAGFLIVPASMAQNKSTEQRVEMERAATEAFRAYASLIRAGKFAESADYYADDPRFVWVEDGSIKYDTKGQIKRALEGIASLGQVQTVYGAPRVWALNDAQVNVFVKFNTTVVERKSGEKHAFSGAISAVMEETAEGWQFIVGHTSSTPASKGF